MYGGGVNVLNLFEKPPVQAERESSCHSFQNRDDDWPAKRYSVKTTVTDAADPGSASSAAPDTPPSMRRELQKLVDDGILPPTAAATRKRVRESRGGRYKCPPAYTDAVRWGYTSPNLPYPHNMLWRHHEGEWILCYKLGG